MFQGFGGFGMGGGHGPVGGGGPMGRVRGAADDDELGKVYDTRVLRRIPEYLRMVKASFALGALGTVMRTLANLAMPYLVMVATDNYIKNGNVNGLTVVALAYLAVSLFMWGGQYLETSRLAYASQGILFRLRTGLFDHLHRLSLGFFDRNKVGKLMSRVQNDVDQLQTLMTQDIISLAGNGLTLIAIAAVMVAMNARLALITLTVVPVLAAALFIWQRRARRAFTRVRRAIAVVNDQLQESISGVRVTQSLSREQESFREFDSVNRAHLDANVEAARLMAFMLPIVQVLTNTAFGLVLVFGGLQVIAGTMGVGVLLAFLLYVQRFFAPVMEMVLMYAEVQRATASGVRIFELLGVEPEIKDALQAAQLGTIKGEIRFQKVGFAYLPGNEVLQGIDLTIRPGETIAIAGRTGAGKSSLTSLIARFYEAGEGAVLVDGQNVNSVTQESLRRQIGIVPQDPFLFSGTIEDNIRYGRLDASHDQVVEAARAAGAHDFVTRLENGYSSTVGERGGNLSAGQRQLICLARAILAEPTILILDEATSSVDTNTERIMQASLRKLSRGRTCVVIAHRLSTVTDADRIVVLEQGKVAESGNHQELMSKKGLYYQMFLTLNQVSG